MSSSDSKTIVMSAYKGEEKRELSLSEKIIQSGFTSYNEGTMEQPDGYARVTGPCGDTMEFSLKIQGNKIIDSRFQVNGCAISRACASIATDLAKGKDVEEAGDIDQETILQQFQQIPEEERHCALLAQNTLRQALENYINGSREKTLS